MRARQKSSVGAEESVAGEGNWYGGRRFWRVNRRFRQRNGREATGELSHAATARVPTDFVATRALISARFRVALLGYENQVRFWARAPHQRKSSVALVGNALQLCAL